MRRSRTAVEAEVEIHRMGLERPVVTVIEPKIDPDSRVQCVAVLERVCADRGWNPMGFRVRARRDHRHGWSPWFRHSE